MIRASKMVDKIRLKLKNCETSLLQGLYKVNHFEKTKTDEKK
jgi:hypothetical protein